MVAKETREHLPNCFMLSASSMQWFEKGHSLVLLVGTYRMVLMSQTFRFPSSSYRFVSGGGVLVVVVVVAVVVFVGGGGVKVVVCVYHTIVTGEASLVWLFCANG
jgi:hypothetical protein